MNWLQKISNWKSRGVDTKEHCHNAFQYKFNTSDAQESILDILDPGIIFYIPDMTNSYRAGGKEELGFDRTHTYEYAYFYFTAHERMYRLDAPMGESMAFNRMPSLPDKLKLLDNIGLVGHLKRIYDNEDPHNTKDLGVIRGSDPLAFANSVEASIQADKDFEGEEYEPVEPLVPENVGVGV